jgi:FtsP/CotA-like multicopper oxidase with cupredoxin domain
MKKLLFLAVLLVAAPLALGQPTVVPACNSFDANGVPIYSALGYGDTTAATPTCTDYFGNGNWATSPLPAGTITGYTLVAGGSGYSSTVNVYVSDPTGAPFSFQLAPGDITGGVITSITGGTGFSDYTMPTVTIVDTGTGSGAMATAVIGAPFTPGTGMLKFQDALKDLRTVIATPDTTTFPGSDYYEIALVQFTQQMHSSLPATTVRGYVQVPTGSTGCPVNPAPTYMGPTIVAQKNRAVRIKFTNCLPIGTGGDLFIPMDKTYMGAGKGPDGTSYTENRAVVHLHGGVTPWISDGTPHQWTVPVGEGGTLQRGASAQNVPDMYFYPPTSTTLPPGTVIPQCSATVTMDCSDPTKANLPAGAVADPGQGSLTYYWTNQQGGRLMFYHDHAYGITRLNVYAGMAAGYLIVDPAEETGLAAATAPGTIPNPANLADPANDVGHVIPLVIQDKSFVPSSAQVAAQDPTWAGNFGATPLSATGGNGDLWFPHVYVPNQNPSDAVGGANGFGHWDYGAWFYPPQTNLTAANPTTAVTIQCTSAAFPGQNLAPTTACPTCGCPIIPNVSGTPEGFMDTPIVNGVAYPVVHVAPAAYRFQILSVGNDRSLNLSWFVADPSIPSGQPGYQTEVAMLPAVPPFAGSAIPLCTAINPVAVPALGLGLVSALMDNSGNPLNGTGLPANCWPNYGPLSGIPPAQTMWAADGRAGGAPDPRLAGPPWVQIGNEGGLLPAPAVIPATPVNYEQNTRSITIGSVAMHGLWLGPAERADVIVDFSQFAGKTLIMYNDAPAPAPAVDSRLDYFTGDGDQTPIGGAPNTQPGYGPNTRTIMQVIVDATNTQPNTVPFSLSTLKAAFASTATTTGLFAATQPTTIVPEPEYNSAYNGTFPAAYMSIQALNLAYTPISYPQIFDNGQAPCLLGQCNPLLDQKTIQELFTVDYGRMNATLGTEIPTTNFTNQTTIPLGYAEWPTELMQSGQTQLWKITHNGVDSHFIHVHLFNAQVINRVGWDGSLRQVDPNEAGWKETIRMNPLEDILIAVQPITPVLPFPLPDSIRATDTTMNTGAATPALSGLDPTTGNATMSTTNALVNFGWEYVWHCHILGHEENDMMRPIIFQVAPPAPSNLVAAIANTNDVKLTWTDNSSSETSFTIQRDTVPATTPTFIPVDSTTAGSGFDTLAYGGTITYTDPGAATTSYTYMVRADDDFNPLSPSAANPPYFVQAPLSSAWSNNAAAGALLPTVTFTGAPASAAYQSTFTVSTSTDSGATPTITGAGACVFGPVTAASATITMTSGTGVCTLTATWPANGSYVAATATQTTTATQAAPTTTFTGAPASSNYNTSFSVTATTNATTMPSITGTPSICTVGPVSGTLGNAQATVSMTSGTGTCTVTASWPADANYQAAVATQTTTAAKDNSTTTITSNAPNPSVAGQPVTVSFSVSSAVALVGTVSGPKGSVTVSDGVVSCTGNLTAGTGPGAGTGTGSCSLTFPTAGAKTLTATYNGDANFNTSTSGNVTQQVLDFSIVFKAPTSKSINGNQKATYTATLTSLNNFAGSVALSCGGTYPGSFSCTIAPTSVTLSAGGSSNATVTVFTLKGSPGTYNVIATGVSGTGDPATGGETHVATGSLTTKN